MTDAKQDAVERTMSKQLVHDIAGFIEAWRPSAKNGGPACDDVPEPYSLAQFEDMHTLQVTKVKAQEQAWRWTAMYMRSARILMAQDILKQFTPKQGEHADGNIQTSGHGKAG